MYLYEYLFILSYCESLILYRCFDFFFVFNCSFICTEYGIGNSLRHDDILIGSHVFGYSACLIMHTVIALAVTALVVIVLAVKISRISKVDKVSRISKVDKVNKISKVDKVSRISKVVKVNIISRVDKVCSLVGWIRFIKSARWLIS